MVIGYTQNEKRQLLLSKFHGIMIKYVYADGIKVDTRLGTYVARLTVHEVDWCLSLDLIELESILFADWNFLVINPMGDDWNDLPTPDTIAKRMAAQL